MNIADYIILLIVLLSALMSLRKGLVNEVLSVATLVGAFLIAHLFASSFATLLHDHISTPSIRSAASYLLLFILTSIVGVLVSKSVQNLIRVVGLSKADRLLGVAFGCLRGAVIVLVAVGLLSKWGIFESDKWWLESMFVPHFIEANVWATQWTSGVISYLKAL